MGTGAARAVMVMMVVMVEMVEMDSAMHGLQVQTMAVRAVRMVVQAERRPVEMQMKVQVAAKGTGTEEIGAMVTVGLRAEVVVEEMAAMGEVAMEVRAEA